MKRIFTVSLSLIILSLPTFAEDHNHFENFEQDTHQIETGDIATIKTSTKTGLDIEVKTRNFKESDKRKLYKAIEILKIVINSQELKEKILNHKFRGQTTFHQNNGITNSQIYNHLMTGAENLKPDSDKIMNFDLTLYRSKNPWSKVKGYTKPDTMRIWLNKKFYKRSSWTPVDVAANMAHEWIHKMGFGHDYYYNEDRPLTVPYAIGYLVSSVAKEFGYK